MNAIETYLSNYDYDYFGNAAEDSLVFFVRDEEAPGAENSFSPKDNAITNDSHETVNGMEGSIPSETDSIQAETKVGSSSDAATGEDKNGFDGSLGKMTPVDTKQTEIKKD